MKICTRCNIEKDLDAFHKSSKRADGRQAWCIECKATIHQNDGERRRKLISANRRKRKSSHRAKVVEYFRAHPCVDCGNTDIRVLEFDHLGDDKLFNISTALGSVNKWSTIENEISKCDVRCANCHKIKTWERLGNTWHTQFLR